MALYSLGWRQSPPPPPTPDTRHLIRTNGTQYNKHTDSPPTKTVYTDVAPTPFSCLPFETIYGVVIHGRVRSYYRPDRWRHAYWSTRRRGKRTRLGGRKVFSFSKKNFLLNTNRTCFRLSYIRDDSITRIAIRPSCNSKTAPGVQVVYRCQYTCENREKTISDIDFGTRQRHG